MGRYGEVAASAERAARLRGRCATPERHPRGARTSRHPGRRQPSHQAVGRRTRRAAVPSTAAGAGSDRRRRRVGADAERHVRSHDCDARPVRRRTPARHRHHGRGRDLLPPGWLLPRLGGVRGAVTPTSTCRISRSTTTASIWPAKASPRRSDTPTAHAAQEPLAAADPDAAMIFLATCAANRWRGGSKTPADLCTREVLCCSSYLVPTNGSCGPIAGGRRDAADLRPDLRRVADHGCRGGRRPGRRPAAGAIV